MTSGVWFALAIMLAGLIGAGLIIRRLGPGKVSRRVNCPEKNFPARVIAIQSEAGWGELRTVDIVKCDLLGPEPVNCEKRCLSRL